MLQLCSTLCDPLDGSPPGSPVPGILEARTLEWVAADEGTAVKSHASGLVNGRLTSYMWQNGRGAKIHRTNKLDLCVRVCVCVFHISGTLAVHRDEEGHLTECAYTRF